MKCLQIKIEFLALKKCYGKIKLSTFWTQKVIKLKRCVQNFVFTRTSNQNLMVYIFPRNKLYITELIYIYLCTIYIYHTYLVISFQKLKLRPLLNRRKVYISLQGMFNISPENNYKKGQVCREKV